MKDKAHLYLFVEIKSEELLLGDLEMELEKIMGVRPGLESFDDFFYIIVWPAGETGDHTGQVPELCQDKSGLFF